MQVKEIHYNKEFEQQFIALPKAIQKKACKCEELFRENPFHPSLRLHKLKGKLDGFWSISIDMKYRIIWKPLADGVILIVSIGLHAIYENK
ncbi:type II toxin-antitoxin system RelE/ParE family toxin [Patescibacteria group bacterium]|nr:type II toxin-antitoxin system RelE/ParE family toxin [Patescibacteria group bacterium]